MQPVHFHGSIVTEYSAPEPLARFSSASKIGRVRATGNDAIAATIWSSSAVGSGSSDSAETACVATAARSPAEDVATKRRRTSSDQAGTRSYQVARLASTSPDTSMADFSRSLISCPALGIALSGQAMVHSMQAVHEVGSKIGTVRRKMPLSLAAAVPAGMNIPVPGMTGASSMTPSRNGLATISS